ncbi:MAG: hypothetical protein LBE36_03650 [Flavobacteriaceae bacterium]|jgi:hypothetical protein|nr:hypothetical protein [Flavobacteriaceae bacterium]
MNSTNLIGLFVGLHKTDKLTNSLEIAGFQSEKIVKYDIDPDVFATSVCICDKYERQMAKNIFDFYKCAKIIETNDTEFDDIRTLIMSHSMAEIVESPEIRHHAHHGGMTSEVRFGVK